MAVKAVEMIRKIRDLHFEKTKNLPIKDQMEYVKKRSKQLEKKNK